jgi:hypothetical protein
MAEELRTDEALLAAFLENADDTAFSAIVQRHGPMVYRVCLRTLADHHEAEDAAQAVFTIYFVLVSGTLCGHWQGT